MIAQLFSDTARQNRDGLAIIDGDERITYGDLLDRIDGISGALREMLNPRPGDVIAASLSNSWQFVACFFAVSRLGAVFMPCNPQWRAPELRAFAERLGFHGVITEEQHRHEWAQVSEVPPQRVLTVDDVVRAQSGSVPAQPRTARDPALYLATSGSTGTPRVVPRSHGNLAAAARDVGHALGMGPGRRLLGMVPFHYSNGVHNCLLMPLLNGTQLVLMPTFTPAACAELVQKERVDVLIGSPFLYSILGDRVADPGLLSTLKLCISSGARMPAGVAERWHERFGTRVRQLYGSTETSVISIDCSLEEPLTGAGSFVGTPIPEVTVRCLGPSGEVLGPGQTGELAVRSPAVMTGYIGEPEWNRRVFHDGFFRTGDLGHIDPNGNLYLDGRLGRVMNIAGMKVDPMEIERVLETLAGISTCHVDATPSSRVGEVIRARVAIRQDVQITRGEIIEHCRQRLAEYKLPRIIEFVEALPATFAGKMPG